MSIRGRAVSSACGIGTLLVGAVAFLSGCSDAAPRAHASVSQAAVSQAAATTAPPASDDFGGPDALGPSTPKRIVSLNPTTTEILFAIGAGDRVVGRSEYDVFPTQATRVPNLGAALRPNVEAVVGAHPDLVILYASQDDRPAYDRLRQAGVATVAFRIDSIGQFERDTRLLGRMTGDSAEAATLVDTVSATLARVRAATAALPRPSVFMPAWQQPIIAIGGGSFLSELLEIAGARNVYADIKAPSAPVALEDVVRRNPDIVLATPVSAPMIRTEARWQAVGAVRRGRVLVFDTTLVSRPSVQLGAAARSLADLIHPGVLPRGPTP